MNPSRTPTLVAVITLTIVSAFPILSASPVPAGGTSIVGAWRLNKDLSDTPPQAPSGGERGRGGRGGSGGRRGGGGGGRGGFGGGLGRGGAGGSRGGARGNPDDMRRMRDAVRDIMEAPERLTIVQTETMVIVTTGDGRTTRLSVDNRKIKDESTGIERKTHWDGQKLVSEITGAGPEKILETYESSADTHQLIVTLQLDSKDKGRPLVHHVYDAAEGASDR